MAAKKMTFDGLPAVLIKEVAAFVGDRSNLPAASLVGGRCCYGGVWVDGGGVQYCGTNIRTVQIVLRGCCTNG